MVEENDLAVISGLKGEDLQCLVFAEAVKHSPSVQKWLLAQTKFASHSGSARLLHEEQRTIRPRKFWWRHWWCHVPELSKDRETDIFMVFETGEGWRFALHCENKLGTGRFEDGQAQAYAPRGRHMANQPKFLTYADFQTVLLAPRAFQQKYRSDCALFDIAISHEEVAAAVPYFKRYM
jgi:hypothetical protein